jgi:thymidine kinase
VVVDGQAILILGDMWQGKTTLLLEMLDQFDVKQLSCDTVVLTPTRADGGDAKEVAADSWPPIPSQEEQE